jgi:HTH-type transcriptional regulator, sugar sensing transcriptional regulator
MTILKVDLLKKLRSAFDLNEYEVKIWIALLSKGVASAGELSDMGNVPRSRAYDVLESLEKKGFIIMKIGRPIKYLAVKPEDILKRVKKNIQDKAEEQVTNIEKIKDTEAFNELNFLFTHGIKHVDPANVSGSFKGRSNTYTQIQTVMESAKDEVILATTDAGLVRKAAYFKESLAKLKKTGVKVKIGAPLNSKEAQEAAESLKNLSQIKKMDTKARFVVVDGSEMVFMLNDDETIHESDDVSIWVNSGFFASSMKSMFDASWK